MSKPRRAAKAPSATSSRARKATPVKRGPEAVEASPIARRTAAVVLEVLAGLRTPAEAAAALDISSTHYYVVETRAVQGFVSALEPIPRGRRVTPEKALEKVQAEKRKVEAELGRTRTLLRMAQRAIGLRAGKATTVKAAGKRPKKGRRTRRPQVRARRAVQALLAPLEAKGAAGADVPGDGPKEKEDA